MAEVGAIAGMFGIASAGAKLSMALFDFCLYPWFRRHRYQGH
jgi:hypothetical protein